MYEQPPMPEYYDETIDAKSFEPPEPEFYGKNDKKDDCKVQFSRCWCENHKKGYDHPQCRHWLNEALSIDNGFFVVLLTFIAFYWVFKIKNRK